MTVNAGNLNGVAHLTVELSVAVHVLLKVAIDALHPAFEVHVLEVDRLGPLLRVCGIDTLTFACDEISLSILLKDRTEDPSVPVEVSELIVFECLIKRSRLRLS
jgi:hypothetical protein